MRQGDVPVQGGPRQHVKRLRLGFADDDFGYAISLGLPEPSRSKFALDPQIKHEAIWAGPVCRPASLLVERSAAMVKARQTRQWQVRNQHMTEFDSLFDHVGSLQDSPEVLRLRERIRSWRFYDHFRTDAEAPARQPRLGTRTPCCTTMAATWPLPCRPSMKSVTSAPCSRPSATLSLGLI